MISATTVLCISIAEKPGTFGSLFHNRAYEMLGLDQVYIPRKVEAKKLESTIASVRALGIKGCSVSMPHKVEVMQYLDSFDSSASNVGAVNTIVRQGDGTLKGYNTDYYGAKKALEENADVAGKDVLMIGAGGAANAIGQAVKDLGGNLSIANRTEEKAKELADKLGAKTIAWGDLTSSKGYLLINATSIGMKDSDTMVVSKETLSNFEVVMDVVISPPKPKLIQESEALGKKTIPGTYMCTYQAAEQVKLYTGQDAPEELIKKTLEEFA
ncbi:MAG: shikimate dehydrogenase [archaeon]